MQFQPAPYGKILPDSSIGASTRPLFGSDVAYDLLRPGAPIEVIEGARVVARDQVAGRGHRLVLRLRRARGSWDCGRSLGGSGPLSLASSSVAWSVWASHLAWCVTSNASASTSCPSRLPRPSSCAARCLGHSSLANRAQRSSVPSCSSFGRAAEQAVAADGAPRGQLPGPPLARGGVPRG